MESSTPQAMRISEIIAESNKDQELLEVAEKINNNSWETADKNVYFPFRSALTTLGSIVLRCSRIIIPTSLRQHTLALAHEGHPEETAMKRRLRAKVWWSLVDRQVEKFVKGCRNCLFVSQPNKPPPMTRLRFPDGPWQCLPMDLMGPLPGQKDILVIIDYFSRYQELKFLKKTTSTVIIDCLMEMFSRLGFPKSIRTDNGRQFVSDEFRMFCASNNITLIHTPPYWPIGNGEVENMNKAIKKRLQICHANNKDYRSVFLMYIVTPHGTTGKTPSELLYNRNIRDKIPSLADITEDGFDEEAMDNDLINKQKRKERKDRTRHAKEFEIKIGDKAIVQNSMYISYIF